jgi:hypothetical protein
LIAAPGCEGLAINATAVGRIEEFQPVKGGFGRIASHAWSTVIELVGNQNAAAAGKDAETPRENTGSS